MGTIYNRFDPNFTDRWNPYVIMFTFAIIPAALQDLAEHN